MMDVPPNDIVVREISRPCHKIAKTRHKIAKTRQQILPRLMGQREGIG
jgi:hypothetical protein